MLHLILSSSSPCARYASVTCDSDRTAAVPPTFSRRRHATIVGPALIRRMILLPAEAAIFHFLPCTFQATLPTRTRGAQYGQTGSPLCALEAPRKCRHTIASREHWRSIGSGVVFLRPYRALESLHLPGHVLGATCSDDINPSQPIA